MKKITWDNMSYYFDGNPGFLISGEFHYFRVPKKDWSYRLDLMKEAGANAAATYVPWILHEPEEGVFRFSDAPETDLDGFLTLCREKELSVIVRPGPYHYSEMRYCGLPGWLLRHYPQILAKMSKVKI
jgi:beta-galactosidase